MKTLSKTILASLVLLLSACSSSNLLTGDTPAAPGQASLYGGKRFALGVEFPFGAHRVGLGITYQRRASIEVTEGEPPYEYPLSDKSE